MKSNGTEYKNYTSEEILQILIDSYNFQAYFCLDADESQLTFQTTIKEWRKICNLLEPTELANFFLDFFYIDADSSELIDLLSNKGATLGIFCNYIANNAMKPIVTPVISFGSLCMEAAIFKKLKNELEKKGIDITDFKPSSDFSAFFYKYSTEMFSIVSKLSPGTLSYYKQTSNFFSKLAGLLFAFSVITPIAMIIFYHITWHVVPLFVVTIILLQLSNKLEQQKSDISGYRTIRDLVIRMKERMEMQNSISSI